MLSRTRKTFAIAAVLAGLAASAGAQVIGKTMTVAGLPACNSDKNFGLVIDATNATTLGAGGGNAAVWVRCISGTWTIDEVAAVADLSAYLPVSGTTAAPIVIQNSGAGNDVSAIALDDLFLTPGDALTAVAGGAVTLTATAGTMALASSAGAVTVTATGATNDITLTATDDVILAPTDALTATVGGAAAVTTTAGAITLTAGGTTQDISLISVDQVILDGEGGADELTIDAASTTVIGAFKLTGSSAPPVACAAGTAGTMYYDSDANVLCVCDATSYKLVADQSSTTGCS